ncbi:MAG: hypothetical protein KJ607_05650 [Bacteroidetes bacterium]|nr:hypothetical protein [Bacteroidota bacterium]
MKKCEIFLSIFIFLSSCSLTDRLFRSSPDSLTTADTTTVITTDNGRKVENDTSLQDSTNDYIFEFRPIVPDRPPYHASRTRLADLVHTVLDISFNREKRQIAGVAVITLTPHFYPIRSVQIDALGFDIHEVKILKDSFDLNPIYVYNDSIITIELEKVYRQFDTVTVSIEYAATPGDLYHRGLAFNPYRQGLYFINPDGTEEDTPRQVWTQNEPQEASCWFPTIDAPNQRMTQEMYITVDYEMTAVSNGELIYSTLNSDSTRTYYWKQYIPHPPYLTAFAAGNFSVVHDEWNGIDVDYYLEPEYKEFAEDIFGSTPEMIGFFSEKFGMEYPWDKYAQVVVQDFVTGAMENTSCTFLGSFAQANRRELLDYHPENIIAHELAHHWFGNVVTCESWANIVLNEAFATYSEYLWAEYRHGADSAAYLLSEMLENYLFESGIKKEGLIRYRYRDVLMDLFDCHSYYKGALVLHTLRRRVGNEAFFSALSAYLKKYRFRSAEIHDLRLVFEEITGHDLNPFFDRWFFGKGHPNVRFSYDYDPSSGNVVCQIKQSGAAKEHSFFHFSLTIEVSTEDTIIRKLAEVNEAGLQVEIPVRQRPLSVWLNTGDAPLAVVEYDNNDQDYSRLYDESACYMKRRAALSLSAGKEKQDQASLLLYLKALNDPFWNIRTYALHCLSDCYDQLDSAGRKNLCDITKIKALQDPSPQMRAETIDFLTFYFREDNLSSLFSKAVNDSSYSVVRKALNALTERYPDIAVEELKSLENSTDRNILEMISTFYIRLDNPGNNRFFQYAISYLKGRSRITVMNNYSYYIRNADDSLLLSAFDYMKDFAVESSDKRIRNTALRFLKEVRFIQETAVQKIHEKATMIEVSDSLSVADIKLLDDLKNQMDQKSLFLDYYKAVISDVEKRETDLLFHDKITK